MSKGSVGLKRVSTSRRHVSSSPGLTDDSGHQTDSFTQKVGRIPTSNTSPRQNVGIADRMQKSNESGFSDESNDRNSSDGVIGDQQNSSYKGRKLNTPDKSSGETDHTTSTPETKLRRSRSFAVFGNQNLM